MDALVILIPLLPFAAAILIGIGILSGVLRGEASDGDGCHMTLTECPDELGEGSERRGAGAPER